MAKAPITRHAARFVKPDMTVAVDVQDAFDQVDHPRVVVGAGDAFVAGYGAALDTAAWAHLDPTTVGLASAAVHVAGTSAAERAAATRSALAHVETTYIGT